MRARRFLVHKPVYGVNVYFGGKPTKQARFILRDKLNKRHAESWIATSDGRMLLKGFLYRHLDEWIAQKPEKWRGKSSLPHCVPWCVSA